MKIKNIFLFWIEMIILFLWGIEIIISLFLWLITFTNMTFNLRRMIFAKVYLWIQTKYRSPQPRVDKELSEFRTRIDELKKRNNDPYDKIKHHLSLILFLFLFACKREDNLSMHYGVNPRSYQIDTYSDSLILYDGNKRIGSCYYRYTQLDSLITKDNL